MTIQPPSPGSPPSAEGQLEFAAEKGGGRLAGLLLAGGILGILLGIGLFLLLLLSSKHEPYMPGLIGGMMVVPIFMIAFAITRLRAPIRVVLDARGLLIERRIAPLFIPWSSIAEVRRDRKSGFGELEPKDVLVLCGERGRVLARILGTLPRFPALVAEVEARSALARGAPTYDRDRNIEQRRRKAKRGARFVMVTGFIFALLGLFVAGQSINEMKHKRAIAREGVDVDATIVRHYRYNVTPHLEYTFQDAQGRTFRRDVMMKPSMWEELEGEKTVSVRYLPSDPDWSIVEGEENTTPEGPPIIAAGVLCSFMGAAFFIIGILGIDIRVEGGKLKIIRIRDMGDELLPDSAPAPVPQVRPAPPVWRPVVTARPPAATDDRPRGVRVLGALNIAFGLLGIVVNTFRLWMVSVWAGKTWTQGQMMLEFAEADRWAWLQYSVNLALAVVLLLSGIGLLAWWQSGRRLALIAASGQVIMGLIALIAAIYVTAQGTDEFDPETRIGVIVGFVGALIVEVLGLIYPTVLLILLGRRPRNTVPTHTWAQTQP